MQNQIADILSEKLTANKTKPATKYENPMSAIAEVEQSIFAALETYANVHRGSGHFSMVTTALYEKAREIVIHFSGKDNGKYCVVFCTPRRCKVLAQALEPEDHKIITSEEVGLKLGVTALIVRKSKLPKGNPFEPGGGTTKLYGADWVFWDKVPERFESGTPAIINIIAFAKALVLKKSSGVAVFNHIKDNSTTVHTLLYSDSWPNANGHNLLEKLLETRIGRNQMVPTMGGTKKFIHLDSSASSPTFEPVFNVFTETLGQSGKFQFEMIQEVKKICLETFGAGADDFEVIFTSNTTEAINLAAQNLSLKPTGDIEPVIMSTVLEHSSNDLPWRQLSNCSIIRLKNNKEGFFDLKEMERLLEDYNQSHRHGKKRIVMVAVSGASNVLGACNDIHQIGKLTRRFGAQLLVDAAQLSAHRKIDMTASNIDCLAFSGHKIYAPFGTGVLIIRKSHLHFGNQILNEINNSANENPGGIAALGKALVLMRKIGFELIQKLELRHTKKLLDELEKVAGITIYGAKPSDADHLGNRIGVVAFDFKNKMAGKIARNLAMSGGIGVRSGCLCAHLLIKNLMNFTPFLEKLQRTILQIFPSLELQGLIRASLGIHNTDEDIDELASELKRMATKPKKGKFSKNEVKQMIKNFTDERIRMVFGKG